MPVVITFHKIREKMPKHGQEIIFLKKVSSFDQWGFEPCEIVADFCWFEVDEEGLHTGNQAVYTEGDTGDDGWELRLLLDGYIAQPDNLWIGVEEYWQCFEDTVDDTSKDAYYDGDTEDVRAYYDTSKL